MSKSSSKSYNNSDLVEIPSEKIQKISSIGVGGFAEVFKGKWEGEDIAIKELFLKSTSDSVHKDFYNEAEILAKCRHPSIVNFFGICTHEGTYQLILEYLPRGSLYDSLANPKIDMPMSLRYSIALSMARGLEYLHNLQIIHRDLKSLNILLSESWQAKITDFGMAKIKIATDVISTVQKKAASIRWCAPELFKKDAERTKQSDIWSLGMIFWELVTRKLPYGNEQNEFIVISLIMRGETESIPEDSPKVFSDIIRNCWPIEPSARIEAAAIVKNLEASPISQIQIPYDVGSKMEEAEPPKMKSLQGMTFWSPFKEANISHDGTMFSCVDSGFGNIAYLNSVPAKGRHRWTFKVLLRNGVIVINVRDSEYVEQSPFDYYRGGCSYASFGSVHVNGNWKSYGDTFETDSEIELNIDCELNEVSFSHNGKFLGVAGTLGKCNKITVGLLLYTKTSISLTQYKEF